jgi:adenylate cyclase
MPVLLQVPLAFFGAVVWNYQDVNKERQNIKRSLGYHLPKEVVDQIAKDVVHIETESQVVYGICLFADMERYTALSERLSPMDLGHLMNRYYESIFKPVKEQKGYISGVIGDAMLAVWATTSAEGSLRKNACRAAVEIKNELNLFNRSSNAPRLRTRIGIHCGQILLGHIGALDHYEYTPIGDIVNTAARIETLNKSLGTGTLVSDEIISQVDGFLSREIGTFKVVGKIKPVGIHELIGYTDECDDLKRQACAAFAEAREAFKHRSWEEASQKFHQVIDRFGADGPSAFYIKLCEQYQNNPPSESWNGVIRMEKK